MTEGPSATEDAPSAAAAGAAARAGGPRERLSVVVVVKDEAGHLPQLLRAVRFADEIVVVDTGSRDTTPEAARELADLVVAYDPGPTDPGGPPPLIHAAKNFGFERAAGPWILNLDADERPTDGLRDEILKLLESPDPAVAAYGIPFTHYFFGRYLRHGGFQGPLVRLFRKGKLRYPEDRAHSSPLVDGRVGQLENLVVHFNHPRITDFVRKMDLYTSQDALLMAQNGRGGLRNRPAPPPGRWTLLRRPLGVFWNRYVRHRGFLDGPQGLVAAGLMAAYQFVESAKLWETLNVPPGTAAGGER
jgi:glycosyltransferase involved in cell wall biosynthesis